MTSLIELLRKLFAPTSVKSPGSSDLHPPRSVLRWDHYRKPYWGSLWCGSLSSDDEAEEYLRDGGEFQQVYGFDCDTPLGAILEFSLAETAVEDLIARLEFSPSLFKLVSDRLHSAGVHRAHSVLYIRHLAYDVRSMSQTGYGRMQFVGTFELERI
jgi:hypothetical protein